MLPYDQLPDFTVGKCTFKPDRRGTVDNVAMCKDLNEDECLLKHADCQLNREPLKIESTKECSNRMTSGVRPFTQVDTASLSRQPLTVQECNVYCTRFSPFCKEFIAGANKCELFVKDCVEHATGQLSTDLSRYRPGNYFKPVPVKNGCVHKEINVNDIGKYNLCRKASYDVCHTNLKKDCTAYFDEEVATGSSKCTHLDSFSTDKTIALKCKA